MPTSLHASRDEGDIALLVIDMVSTWKFPDAEKLLAQAARIAPAIARLKARFKAAGMPVVYANDNHGRWRSSWHQLMEAALAEGESGARIATLLAPDGDDYFVLKPMHSAFFATPMQLLLQHLRVRHLVLTGVASDQCVVTTAATARMHGYEVSIPRNAVASQTPARSRAAIVHFEQVMKVSTTPTSHLRLDRLAMS